MKIISACITISLLLIISGCASLMPSTVTKTNSPWEDYTSIKQVFDAIEPYKTTMEDLKQMSIDPYKTPNTRIINALTIKDMFTNNKLVPIDSMPDGIKDCFKKENFDKCVGFEYSYKNTKENGVGNLPLRMLAFRKENRLTGHDVKFYIFMKYDEQIQNYVVVYKLIPEGDTAGKDETRVEKRPLGPLQEPADFFRDRIVPK